MRRWEMKDIEGTAYTLIAYSKALRCKVRLIIWQMPNGKKKLFFSTDPSLSGEEVLLYYRTRNFHIEFCFRDAKGYTGLMDCQARDKWKLEISLSCFVHITKCCQGNYEGDGKWNILCLHSSH